MLPWGRHNASPAARLNIVTLQHLETTGKEQDRPRKYTKKTRNNTCNSLKKQTKTKHARISKNERNVHMEASQEQNKVKWSKRGRGLPKEW